MDWDKNKIKDIVKTLGPYLISIVAIFISIRSCNIAGDSLNLNMKEFEKRRESRYFIASQWIGDKIYVSSLIKKQVIGATVHGELYGGLEGFIDLKITNTSDHTISIDGIKVAYCLKSSIMSIPWGSTFKTIDKQTDIIFPIVLNPFEPFQCMTRIPIPISSNMVNLMHDLHSDTTYSSKDILLRLAYYLIKTTAIPNSIDSMYTKIKKELEFLAIITGGMQNVPEVLIQYSDPELKVRRGERVIEVHVKLSSGELKREKIDYIDIIRSQFDLL